MQADTRFGLLICLLRFALTIMFFLSCVHLHTAQDGGPEEEGCVDWSQWNGELTQSSAACNRKVQPLLRRNRELRGLVLDDPPDNSGLPEFSYARGRRGYTKPPAGHLLLPRPTVPTSTPAAAAAAKVVHTATANGGGASASATANATATATVAGISGGKVSSETPVRTPSPPIERPHSTPPTPSSVHDRAYFVEVCLSTLMSCVVPFTNVQRRGCLVAAPAPQIGVLLVHQLQC